MIQPEEDLSQSGRRFRAHFGAEWWQCAFPWPFGLRSTVATSAWVMAGLGCAGDGCCMLASSSWLQPHTAILQTLSPKGIPASSARKTLIREKVNWERQSEGKAGEPLVQKS